VIAAIEGFCLGGGLELAICCDYRIAGASATFGLPEVRKLNVLPSWGGLTRLPKLIGLAEAKALVLMGERLSAERALSIGLAHEVVADGAAFARASGLAQEYAATVGRNTITLAKQTLLNAYGVPRSTAQMIDRLVDFATDTEGALGASRR
jgi:enoyl-CoA hydratase/carnithine racemase